jgi:hypothetical protein
MLLNRSRKIAYTATFLAITVIALVAARFLPLSVVPFTLMTICLMLVFKLCGLGWGLLLYLASAGISFLFFPAGLVYCIFAGPHAIALFLLSKVYINNRIVKYAVEYGVLLVFANAAFFGIYCLADTVLFDMSAFVERLGGYYIALAVILSLVFVIYDLAVRFMFGRLSALKVFR